MATAKAQGVVLELSNDEARALQNLFRETRQEFGKLAPLLADIEDALLSEIGAYECD